MAVIILLPMPPSANSIWRGSGRHVYRSKSYMSWITEAGYLLNAMRIKMLPPPYVIEYAFGRKDKRKSDVDNRAKPLGDLLQRHAIISNDCEIKDLRLLWSDEVASGMVRISIKSEAVNAMESEAIEAPLQKMAGGDGWKIDRRPAGMLSKRRARKNKTHADGGRDHGRSHVQD